MTVLERILPVLINRKVGSDSLGEILARHTTLLWAVTGVLSVALLGVFDYLTGNEINFSFFYLAPIILVTWSVHQNLGLIVSVLSALACLLADLAGNLNYHSPMSYFWNTLIHIGFFVLLTHLISRLKETQQREQLAARTDFVTGVANRRYFHELLEMEIERMRRYPHPITVVYMDADNFKQVNDLFGHKVGDQLLSWIAREMKSHLRVTDSIARLGGDEFALLLPSARLSEAKVVLSKLRATLTQEMRQRNWPVTFSIGVVVCTAPPFTAEQIIDKADELMYQVKNNAKNGVRFTIWDGKSFARA